MIGLGEAGGSRNLSVVVAPYLPFLRRFARALCGEQSVGDGVVASVLEALIADRNAMDPNLPPKLGLYALFYRIWSATEAAAQATPGSGEAAIPARGRVLLLLTKVEDFSVTDAAAVMGIDTAEAESLLSETRRAVDSQARAKVLVIEDEPIIALDLENILGAMGHAVVGVADTHAGAVTLAAEHKPDLVLADIQLADGSSGIQAVAEILTSYTVPIVFVTAFPERLLTGERPEPTFLVTKPFQPQAIEAAVSQALYHVRSVATAASGA